MKIKSLDFTLPTIYALVNKKSTLKVKRYCTCCRNYDIWMMLETDGKVTQRITGISKNIKMLMFEINIKIL